MVNIFPVNLPLTSNTLFELKSNLSRLVESISNAKKHQRSRLNKK